MIKPEQIPDAAVTEAAIERWGVNEPTKWELDTCRIIIAAAINAWPGVMTERRARCDAVVLPYNLDADLPQEASDD